MLRRRFSQLLGLAPAAAGAVLCKEKGGEVLRPPKPTALGRRGTEDIYRMLGEHSRAQREAFDVARTAGQVRREPLYDELRLYAGQRNLRGLVCLHGIAVYGIA